MTGHVGFILTSLDTPLPKLLLIPHRHSSEYLGITRELRTKPEGGRSGGIRSVRSVYETTATSENGYL